MELAIRERYRFKNEAMMNEIQQGGWTDIDTRQLNADIGTDMKWELRVLQQTGGTNVKDEEWKYSCASGNDVKLISGNRTAVSEDAGIGLRHKSTKGHIASSRRNYTDSTQIPKGEFPWTEIDENRVKYANKPLPPTPTTAVQAEQARKRAASKTGLYLLGKNPPIEIRKEKRVVVAVGRGQVRREQI